MLIMVERKRFHKSKKKNRSHPPDLAYPEIGRYCIVNFKLVIWGYFHLCGCLVCPLTVLPTLSVLWTAEGL